MSRERKGLALFLEDVAENLVGVLREHHRKAAEIAVFAVCADVLAVQEDVRFPSRGGHAAETHPNDAPRQVLGPDARLAEIADHQFEVGADLVPQLVAAQLGKKFATNVDARMWRHVADVVHPGLPPSGGVIADRLVATRKENVRISRIRLLVKGRGNSRDGVGVFKDVIRVEDADDVSRRHRDALVEGVVHPLVFFGGPSGGDGVWFGQLFRNQLAGAVRRTAVHDDVLDFSITLRENACDRGSDRILRIVGNRDDADLHGRRNYITICARTDRTHF